MILENILKQEKTVFIEFWKIYWNKKTSFLIDFGVEKYLGVRKLFLLIILK